MRTAPPAVLPGATMRGIVAMNVSMAAFTVNDAMMKQVTLTLPLMQAILIRGALTMLALLVLIRVTRTPLTLLPADRRRMGWRTFAEIFATLAFLGALTQMPLANLSAIMQATPLAVTLAAALFLGEAAGWRRMAAIAVGFVGVMMIVKPGTAGFDVWSLVGLASVGFVVLRDLVTRSFATAVPSVLVAIWSAAGVTAMGALGVGLAMAQGPGWVPVSPEHIARLCVSSAALVFGYIFSVRAMRHGDVAQVAPFRYASLVWAILLGWLLFGTLPDLLTWAGAGLVVASGLFTLWREALTRRRMAGAHV